MASVLFISGSSAFFIKSRIRPKGPLYQIMAGTLFSEHLGAKLQTHGFFVVVLFLHKSWFCRFFIFHCLFTVLVHGLFTFHGSLSSQISRLCPTGVWPCWLSLRKFDLEHNVNLGLTNHGLLMLINLGRYSSNSHNLILEWYPPN